MCHQKAVLKNRFAVLRYMIGMMRTVFLWYSTFDFMIQFIYANTLWTDELVIFESDLYNFDHFGNIINFYGNDKYILRYKMLMISYHYYIYIWYVYIFVYIIVNMLISPFEIQYPWHVFETIRMQT